MPFTCCLQENQASNVDNIIYNKPGTRDNDQTEHLPSKQKG